MSLISNILNSIDDASAPQASGSASDQTSGSAGADFGPTWVPRYQLTETADGYGLTVELPGVDKDGLELSVDGESVRVVGRRAWSKPEAWTARHRETRDAHFTLVLDHGRTIDPEHVQAELRDGQLRVSLSKAGALKPRRITVT